MLWLIEQAAYDLSRIGCVRNGTIRFQSSSSQELPWLEFQVEGLNIAAWTKLEIRAQKEIVISTALYNISHRKLYPNLDQFYWKILEMNYDLPSYGKVSEKPGTGGLTWQTGFSIFEYHEKTLRTRLNTTSDVIDYYYLAIAALARGEFGDNSPVSLIDNPPDLLSGDGLNPNLLRSGEGFDPDVMKFIEELKKSSMEIDTGETASEDSLEDGDEDDDTD